MKLKLTHPSLARIAELLVDSVVRGHREDIQLRDHVLASLRAETDRRTQRARQQAAQQTATEDAQRPFQPHAFKGI